MTRFCVVLGVVLIGCGGQPFSGDQASQLDQAAGSAGDRSSQLDHAGGSSASGGRSNSLEQKGEAGSPDDAPALTGFIEAPSVLVVAGAAGRSLRGSFRLLLTAQGQSVTVSAPKFKLINEAEPVLDPLNTMHDGVAFPIVIDAGVTKSGTFTFEIDAGPPGLCDGPVRIEAAIGDVVIDSDAVVATCD